MDVCSKDDSFDKINLFPKDESYIDFFRRCYTHLIDKIVLHDRLFYYYQDLRVRNVSIADNFIVHEFNLPSILHSLNSTRDKQSHLHYCLWQNKNQIGNDSNEIIFIYLHTNTRALIDSLEIIELCDKMNASLLSFDLPNHGQSECDLGIDLHLELQNSIKFIHKSDILAYKNPSIFIWARGSSTFIPVQYFLHYPNDMKRYKITSVILDSPFKTVEELVHEYVLQMKASIKYPIPSIALNLGIHILHKSIIKRLNFNPFDIKITEYIGKATVEFPPLYIIAADHDDYISVSHSEYIRDHWRNKKVEMRVFHGGHFGTRPVEVVMETIAFLSECLHSQTEPEVYIEDIDSLSELPVTVITTPMTMPTIFSNTMKKSKSLSSLRNYCK